MINLEAIYRIIHNGVMIVFEAYKKTARLDGKIFVLTGSMESMTRRHAKEMIVALGGKVSASVSRNTDFVIAGKSPGSKLDRAKALGLEILDEAGLKEMLKKYD